MTRPRTRILWRKPSETERRALLRPSPLEALAAEQPALHQTLLQVGVPFVEGATTARESAIELLKLAAEVEHALMAQYLYAAYSLPDRTGPGPVNYHDKLKRIAVQEMGHLATVQNLLLILGGPAAFYMQRDILREQSDKNPLPFVVERVSKVSLAKYVAAEMPAEVPEELKVQVDELVELAKADVGDVIHRVGVIYAVLKWMFLPAAEANDWLDLSRIVSMPENSHLTDADLRPQDEIAAFEARRVEWGMTQPDLYLDSPRTCAKAVEAIERISRQGEGLTSNADSHFFEFLETVNELQNLPVKNIAKSPTLGGGHGASGGERITHPYTSLWGRIFVLQYSSLVLSIYFALSTRRREDGEDGLREEVAGLAIQGMRVVIGPVSEIITTLRLRDDGSADLAGPPYDLDPAVLEPADSHVLVARQIEMLNRLETIYAQTAASPDATPQHLTMLGNLQNFDRVRREILMPPAPPDS